ncbi:hypothetical protein MINT15_03750 [Saccharomonospora viridis]|uniref:Uncharacterized protein n=1 Tax=Saccharomonospora viridis TaxID=1852 RepID=A0A837DIA2_9PSEU|nr:hypothetical protein MINT15_03750 [Saccharomonospora viridis]
MLGAGGLIRPARSYDSIKAAERGSSRATGNRGGDQLVD